MRFWINENGLLFETKDSYEQMVEQGETPNKGGKLDIRAIVLHYTAGPSIEGTLNTFKNPKRQASAHIVIDRDSNRMVQVVNFRTQAWHAGKSKWGKLVGLNRYSIGIEIVNSGYLRESQSGNFYTWYGKLVPPDDVVAAQDPNSSHRFWHRYTDTQIDTVIELVSALSDRYKTKIVLGHSEIAPGRKLDPGPAFPMNNVRSLIGGRKDG